MQQIIYKCDICEAEDNNINEINIKNFKIELCNYCEKRLIEKINDIIDILKKEFENEQLPF